MNDSYNYLHFVLFSGAYKSLFTNYMVAAKRQKQKRKIGTEYYRTIVASHTNMVSERLSKTVIHRYIISLLVLHVL